jgi:hypothetical protein
MRATSSSNATSGSRPTGWRWPEYGTTLTTPSMIAAEPGDKRCIASSIVRSGEVEAIKIHHFVPRRDEVVYEFFLPVGASVNFGQGAEL